MYQTNIRRHLPLVLIAVAFFLGGLYTSKKLSVSFNTGSAANYSITLNQINPRYGDAINFTGVYPKEAAIKIGRRQQVNPVILLNCYQNNIQVYSRQYGMASSFQNADGSLTGISVSFTLGGSSNELSWTGGAAECYAHFYYWKKAAKGSTELTAVTLGDTNFFAAE